MKLRYTPYQVKVNAVEDHESKYHDVINEFETLDNMPVVVGTLHSMLTPFVASYKRHNPNKKLVYIMTDGAALPIYLSKNVQNLKDKKLIDSTITIGNRDVSGLKGHFKSLFKGKLTTGGFKALFGGFVGLIISVCISKNIADIIVNTLVIALSTNLMNLFDLRPGRAIKVYLVIMIAIFFTLTGYVQILPLLIIPNVLAYFNYDLKAKAMMGDTGSNVLGISIGILMVMGYTFKVRVSWLVFLVLIHILTEKFSLTKIIEKNKVLNFIDKLGR